ncbi:MAG: hypothetical protein NTX94_05885 [Caldiserica bacterium]|nr:hypothetical protein [Caldisericota bacterium]
MEDARRRFRFIWIPRALMILFVVFLTMFSFDVFEMEGTLLAKLGGFVMHSIPSIVLAAFVALTWKTPLIVGIVDLVLALAYTVLVWSRGYPQWALGLALPLAVVGVLFIVSHVLDRKPTRSGGEQA